MSHSKLLGMFFLVIVSGLAIWSLTTMGVNVLSNTEKEATDDKLLLALKNPDPLVKIPALRDLERLIRGGKVRDVAPYVPSVRACLRDKESLDESIIGILQQSPKDQCKSCIPDVTARLGKDTDSLVVRQGLIAVLGFLASTEDKSSVERLVTILKTSESPILRKEASLALGNLSGQKSELVEKALENGEKDSDKRVSIASGLGLWNISNKPDVGKIILALEDDNVDVRVDAAGALSQIVNAKAQRQLEPALQVKVENALKKKKRQGT